MTCQGYKMGNLEKFVKRNEGVPFFLKKNNGESVKHATTTEGCGG